MKTLGISVFTGMEQSVDQNINYIKMAAGLGYKALFTSLHIPEADYRSFFRDCQQVVTTALNCGFEITADVSPRSWSFLGIQPVDLSGLGIHTIRADFGFSPAQIHQLLEESGLCLEVNASALSEQELSALLGSGLKVEKLRAGHNYYPHPETGLGFGLFAQRSQYFKRAGIPVSAFIPGRGYRRGPISAGLPTVEKHRGMSAAEAARQFWASGLVDTIIFGDPLVSEQELASVADLPKATPETLTFRVALDAGVTQEERKIFFAPKHTNRLDASECVARSQESRALLSENSPLLPRKSKSARPRGDITIDNALYGRYAGELQIVMQDLPADSRVNRAGKVIDEDRCLLECLLPGRIFCLKEAENHEI